MTDQAVATTGEQRIASAFDAARDEDRAALMPYMMGGFPDQATATRIAEAYADAGADLIELGVPFSDPLADGPTIHAADTAALKGGATLETVLDTCAAVGDRVPVIVMCYANPVLFRGPELFAKRLAGSGASGAIVPDLPLEESEEISAALDSEGLPLIPMVAPTTPAERRRRICERAKGFVYVVSTTGVTGEREGLPPELTDLVTAVRDEATVPAAVGFGISTPEQAARVAQVADGVIVGTRMVRAVAEAPDGDAAVAAVTDLLASLGPALKR